MNISVLFTIAGDVTPEMLRGEDVWIVSSALTDAKMAERFEGGGGDVRVWDDAGIRPSDRLARVVREIGTNTPNWSDIRIVGLTFDSVDVLNILAPKGEPSGIFVRQSETVASGSNGIPEFVLTKVLPKPPDERLKVWRDNLPPKGLLTLTEAAASRILELQAHLQSEEPDQSWIPSLSWGPRRVADPGSGEWRDLGQGFTLGFFPRHGDYPVEAVEACNGIDLIFRLGFDHENFRGKSIDYRKGEGGFVLVP